jgi:hypothetical protein
MSAFPESGCSTPQKLGEIRVRFRPEAAVNWALLVFAFLDNGDKPSIQDTGMV